MTRAWTRCCAACCVRKGLIFLILCNANLLDRAVFAMWYLKVSCSLKITPRFLTELDGVIVAESIWMVKSCCRVGVTGKARSSVFARLSCRWCSFIHAWAVRQAAWDACSYCWIIWSKWEIELCVISIAMVGDTMCLYDGTQWCSVCGPQWLVDVLWIPPLPRPPWRTCQWDRIQTSEVESLWCPVMREWIGWSEC